MANANEWTEMVRAVAERHTKGEISGAEYHAFLEWVDEAESRGWSPETCGFDPESFEERLEDVTNSKGLVRKEAPIVNNENYS